MGKKTFSSDLVHLLFVLLLLCTLLCRTESAFTSHDESLSLSLTGRKLKSIYRPNGAIFTRPSSSQQGGGGHARRLMSEIDVGASSSGQGRRLMNDDNIDVGASISGQGEGRIN